MINRVIFEGNVYYKVADLADLFGVSVYKMRKAIKDEGVGTTLKSDKSGVGFGRSVFVLEANVAKLVVNQKKKVLKTNFDKNPVQETVEVQPEAPKEKPKNKQLNQQKQQLKVVDKAMTDTLRGEHASTIEEWRLLIQECFAVGKVPLADEIFAKHLGIEYKNYKDVPLDKLDEMKAAVDELQTKLKKFVLPDEPILEQETQI